MESDDVGTLSILNGSVRAPQIVLPKWLSADAHSLLRSLLERNVSKRLGGGKSTMFVVRGVQALKSHPFFKVCV
jgi:ribosomal protein S6 kinase beta